MSNDGQPAATRPEQRPRRRPPRFVAKVLLANVIALSVTLSLCEIGVRMWREGGVMAGVRSLATDQPMPRDLGTGDWLASDPERGYVLRAGANGINDLHVRHAAIVAPKPAGVFRLLLLGDSVSWPDTGFASLLQHRCDDGGSPAVELINASVPGYTTWQEGRHLDAIGAPIDPDAVVLQYCCNDNHRFLHQWTGPGGLLITEEARRALLPEGDGLFARIGRWSYLALELRRLLVSRRGGDSLFPWLDDPAFAAAWRSDSWPMVEREIAHISAVLRARGCKFAVVAVPYEAQLRDELLARDPAYVQMPQRRLAACCAQHSIPLLDLFDAFHARRADGLYLDGIHLAPTGHELAATRLLPFLRDNGLLPPR